MTLERDVGEGVEVFTTCSTAGPMFVHVREGKILRIEPMQFDPQKVKSWQVEAQGQTYKPPLTHPLLPWGITSKHMAYSEHRVNYPMKRIDWDPCGQRNADKRGQSGYERISWDEAFKILEDEYNRILDEYGPSALCYTHSAHPEWGSLHYLFSDLYRFRDLFGGTYLEFTPNSWEGWACGGPFLWGFWMGHGIPPAEDTLQDISIESDMIILWGSDPMFHNVYNGVDTARLWQWWHDLGKEIIVIDPLFNETAAAVADVWLPIYPGTDNALAAAIAYQWVVDDTCDWEYLDTHTVGFDEDHMEFEYNEAYLDVHPAWKGNLPRAGTPGMSFKSYLMGEGPDGIAKTPGWAAEICGIEARRIVALARAWAKRPTSLWGSLGGQCRRTFGHEVARMIGTLITMRGMGTPGNNLIGGGLSLSGPYDGQRQLGPTGYADGGMNVVLNNYYPNPVPQAKITFTKLMDCVKNPPQKWRGGHLDNFGPEMFFDEVEYPQPGCTEIRLLWMRGSTLTNPPDHKNNNIAYTDPQIETLVVAAPWFDRDCRFADLVLPITTIFERQDITEPASVGQYVPPAYNSLRSAVYNQKAIEPVGESKTDLEIFEELANRLGRGEEFMEGNTEETILQKMFARTNIPLEYDEFKAEGYYVWPALDDYVPNKQFQRFHDNPVGGENVMETPTGKVEIYSTLIAAFYGDENHPEIPAVPHYVPEVNGRYDEKRREYPLQQLMAHPKFRFHGKYDKDSWLAENYKVYGRDGYAYEPCLLNPVDARARGIEDGDIVRCFNDRGQILAGAVISDRVMEGVSQMTYGAWNDPLSPEHGSLDRSGDGNVLSYAGPQSIHHVGGAFNSSLMEVEKVDFDEIFARYPEGFAGKWSSWNREG
jgi:trimethylamine-N-oxide reductase (cytochrome c)